MTPRSEDPVSRVSFNVTQDKGQLWLRREGGSSTNQRVGDLIRPVHMLECPRSNHWTLKCPWQLYAQCEKGCMGEPVNGTCAVKLLEGLMRLEKAQYAVHLHVGVTLLKECAHESQTTFKCGLSDRISNPNSNHLGCVHSCTWRCLVDQIIQNAC